MPQPLVEIVNQFGLLGTLAWLLIGYAALHALLQGQWLNFSEALLRLLWKQRHRTFYGASPRSGDDEDYRARDDDIDYGADYHAPAEMTAPLSESVRRLSRQATQLERLLHAFGINATVVNVEPGPLVTLFELRLGFAVSGKELSARSGDIARILRVNHVRILESLPGRSSAGVEVPNRQRRTVYLKQLSTALEEREPLSVILGVDTFGQTVVDDLATMPHLLVAGTTGAGKSVVINTLLACLLERNDARRLRLILIDPKALEFALYDAIPQLLCPIVTDSHESGRALAWCVGEMERRYTIMGVARSRNIDAYNRKMIDERRADQQLPYIVVVVDELADLMLSAAKTIEPLLQRLAQKARAAGIHLILATQRPTTDVISGSIKSNIRTRLALALPTQTDSRTVIDQVGAEKLLDKGDALLMTHRGIQRIHCPLIGDDEIGALVERLRAEANGETDYVDVLVNSETTTVIDLPSESDEPSSPIAQNDRDAAAAADWLYDDAVQLVVEQQKATKVLLKTQLGIGDGKAEALLRRMERAGIVGQVKGRGNRRRVLLDTVPETGVGELARTE